MKLPFFILLAVVGLVLMCAMVDPAAAINESSPLYRPTAEATIEPLDNSPSEAIMGFLALNETYVNETASERDFGGLVSELFSIYSDVLGPIALLIVFAMPFAALWIMQKDMLIPGGIGLMFSSFILVKLPADFQAVAVLMMALSVTGVIYAMYTRR